MNGQSIPRPTAILAVPGSRPLPAEDQEQIQEETDRQMRREELRRRDIVKGNKVAQMLSATYFITDKTFPFLTYKGRQLSVSEYYPDEKIAVDKFYFSEKIDPKEIEFKREMFKENGFKYGFLSPDKKLADLADELGLA